MCVPILPLLREKLIDGFYHPIALFFFFHFYFLFMAVLGLRCYTWAFSSCCEQGLLSSCSAGPSHCSGFSGCGAQALGHKGFRGCGAQAQLQQGLQRAWAQ